MTEPKRPIGWFALVSYIKALPCKQCGSRSFLCEYGTNGMVWERAKCNECGLVQDVRPPNARS